MIKTEKQIENKVRQKNKDDVKNQINPLYSIKIGSPYASEEMFRDVEDLMIAVASTFYNMGFKDVFHQNSEVKE